MNKVISEPDTRPVWTKTLAFENSNLECKRVIRALKTRSAPIEEWIKDTADLGSHVYDATF